MDDPSAASKNDSDDAPNADRPDGGPGPGLVEIRGALVGLGLIWLTVFAAFGSIAAAVYGLTVSIEYLLASAVAAAVALVAGTRSLRTFGYR